MSQFNALGQLNGSDMISAFDLNDIMSIHRSGNTIRTVITTIRMVNHVFARFDIMADQPLSLEHRK